MQLRTRTLLKSCTWQCLGVGVIYCVTGDLGDSLLIPAIGFVCYYLHESAWHHLCKVTDDNAQTR